jgi:hypothetical protein
MMQRNNHSYYLGKIHGYEHPGEQLGIVCEKPSHMQVRTMLHTCNPRIQKEG